jgi:hypothetical protein
MSTIEIKTLDKQETAFLLFKKLGPLRVWHDFLADCLRGKQDIYGLILIPCCMQKGSHNFAPRYSLRDIAKFIEAVLAVVPEAGPRYIEPVTLEIDPARNWRKHKFDKLGKPVMHTRSWSSH